ncbi:hypothetical protein ABIB62_004067 [Mucilaginibacter sp. UYP25]
MKNYQGVNLFSILSCLVWARPHAFFFLRKHFVLKTIGQQILVRYRLIQLTHKRCSLLAFSYRDYFSGQWEYLGNRANGFYPDN